MRACAPAWPLHMRSLLRSHIALLALAAAAALFLRGVRGRGGPAAFGASGLLLGLAAGMRYTDVLLALPAIVWLALEPSAPRALRRRRGAIAGARRRIRASALALW